MRKVKSQLEKLEAKIEEKIEDRNICFDERSEKWQESEKGELYQEKTDVLADVLDNLVMTIESVEQFLDN